MNSIQKRLLEIPLFLFLNWLFQAIELATIHWNPLPGRILPMGMFIVFLIFLHPLRKIILWSVVFAWISATTRTDNLAVFLSSFMIASLLVGLVSAAMALEGRRAFGVLCGFFLMIQQLAQFALMSWVGQAQIFSWSVTGGFVVMSAIQGAIGFLIYPGVMTWLEYFERRYAKKDEMEIPAGLGR